MLFAIEIANATMFATLAIVASVQWFRQRGEATKWLALTFIALSGFVFSSLLTPAGDSVALDLLQKTEIALLVLFPYFLYRFMGVFVQRVTWVKAMAVILTGGVIVWTYFLPHLKIGDGEPPLSVELWFGAFILQWSVLSLLVTIRLWRAGRGQPSVARRRMRFLSVGAFGMTAALIVAGSYSLQGSLTMAFGLQVVVLLSVTSFFLGFAPPAWLRTVWRRPESQALRVAIGDLMAARTTEEVAHCLLPPVVRITGARGAALLRSDGDVIATHDVDPDMLLDVVDAVPEELRREVQTPDLLVLPFEFGSLMLWASLYTPFFGREEVDLVRSLGALTDVALERAALVARESEARRQLETTNEALSDAFTRERLSRIGVERANEELESFVYTVSHDLNSPLISILGFLELLEQDIGTKVPAEVRFYMERMTASARFMQSLIRDLLELSRVGRVQTDPEEVDVEELIEDISEEIKVTHPEVEISTAPIPAISMNPLRARQLFANLMQNSVKYSGRPDVRISVTAEPDPNGFVSLSVVDNGPGIPEQYRDRVFGVFERLENSQEGTGIGLAVCKRIVETSGGNIWIADSEEGTDVRLTVPASTGAKPMKETRWDS